MEDFKEFMIKNRKCAESLYRWMNDNNFDNQVMCRVFVDYFIASTKQSNISIKSTVTLIKKLYELPSMFFSDKLDDDDDVEEDSDCDEEDEDSDCNTSISNEDLKEKLAMIKEMKSLVEDIKHLNESIKK